MSVPALDNPVAPSGPPVAAADDPAVQPVADAMPTAEWPYKWHLLIFFVAIILRGIYFLQYLRSPLNGQLRVDHAYYFEWARQIYAGDWLGSDVFEMSPLYPYLLAGIMHLTGVKLNWLIVVQLLLGASSCMLVYACANRLFEKRTAILAGVVAAAYGPQICERARRIVRRAPESMEPVGPELANGTGLVFPGTSRAGKGS